MRRVRNEYFKAYNKANAERKAAYNREYYAKHKDTLLAADRERYRRNAEQLRADARARRAAKRLASLIKKSVSRRRLVDHTIVQFEKSDRRRHKITVDPLPLLTFGRPYYVYVYRDPRPGKERMPLYVGKGTKRYARAEFHWLERNRRNPFLNRVLSKIAEAELVPIVEIIQAFDTEQDAFNLERALINQYGRRNIGTGTLCNLTDGGEGPNGLVMTLKTRQRMSAVKKGKRPSLSCLLASNAARRGASHTPAARAKISAARKGKPRPPCSPEAKAKMSAARKAYWARRKAEQHQGRAAR